MSVSKVLSFPNTAERRLARALSRLAEAQAVQAAAVAEFRQNLVKLREETECLHGSMMLWQREVEGVQRQVSLTRSAVDELGATAARM